MASAVMANRMDVARWECAAIGGFVFVRMPDDRPAPGAFAGRAGLMIAVEVEVRH